MDTMRTMEVNRELNWWRPTELVEFMEATIWTPSKPTHSKLKS